MRLNNKIKVIKMAFYRYVNFDDFRLGILFVLKVFKVNNSYKNINIFI